MLSPFSRRAAESLTLFSAQDTLYLPEAHDDTPSDDQLLSGRVELRMPARSRARIERVQVMLERCTYITAVGGDRPVMSRVTSVAAQVEQDTCDVVSFAYTLIVPSADTAGTVDSKHGNVRYFVSAVGTFERGARKPLQSKKVPITILDQPKLEYGAPAPTAEYFSSTAEDLSHFQVEFGSSFLTVGAIATVGVSLVTKSNATLLACNAFISECIEYESSIGANLSRTTQHIPLIRLLERGCTVDLSANGDAWTQKKIARLPIDTTLSPSTRSQNIPSGWMSFKHKIVVEVVYRTEGAEEDQIALAEKPIYIASCYCAEDGFQLPMYAANEMFKAREFTTPVRKECLCTKTFMQLVKESSLLRGDDGAHGAISFKAPAPQSL